MIEFLFAFVIVAGIASLAIFCYLTIRIVYIICVADVRDHKCKPFVKDDS